MPKDFSPTELKIINEAIGERWKEVEIHLADIEITRTALDEKTTLCPAAVWETADCTFVVIKADEFVYKSVFYYLGSKQIDTGVSEYNDLRDCVLTLMKVQANFMLSSSSSINIENK
jgi:hypothetical protein